MKQKPAKKGVVLCLIITLVFSVLFLAAGFWQMHLYRSLSESCTAVVQGVVVNEGSGQIPHLDPAQKRYLTGRHWRYIEVETDGIFRFHEIYADPGAEQEGDEILLHYDPRQPDRYYLSNHVNHYKKAGFFAWGAGGLTLTGSICLMITLKKM